MIAWRILFLNFCLLNLGFAASNLSEWNKVKSLEFFPDQLSSYQLEQWAAFMQGAPLNLTTSYVLILSPRTRGGETIHIKQFKGEASLHEWSKSSHSPFGLVQEIEDLLLFCVGTESDCVLNALFREHIPQDLIISTQRPSDIQKILSHLTGLPVRTSKAAAAFLKRHESEFGSPFVFYFQKEDPTKQDLAQELSYELGLKIRWTYEAITIDTFTDEEIRSLFLQTIAAGQSDAFELKRHLSWMRLFPDQLKDMLARTADRKDYKDYHVRYGLLTALAITNHWNPAPMMGNLISCLSEQKKREHPEPQLACLFDVPMIVPMLRLKGGSDSITYLKRLADILEDPKLRASFNWIRLDALRSVLQLSPTDPWPAESMDVYINRAARYLMSKAESLVEKMPMGYTIFDKLPDGKPVEFLFRPGPLMDSNDLWIGYRRNDELLTAFTGLHSAGRAHVFSVEGNHFWVGWGVPWLEESKDPRVTKSLTLAEILSDRDRDGLTDLLEMHAGTKHDDNDTDDDGVTDAQDVTPLNPDHEQNDTRSRLLELFLLSELTPISETSQMLNSTPVFHVFVDFPYRGKIKLPCGWVVITERKVWESASDYYSIQEEPKKLFFTKVRIEGWKAGATMWSGQDYRNISFLRKGNRWVIWQYSER